MKTFPRQDLEADKLLRKQGKLFKKWLESKLYLNSIIYYSPKSINYSESKTRVYLSVAALEATTRVYGLTNFLKGSYLDRIRVNNLIRRINNFEANIPTKNIADISKRTLEIIAFLQNEGFLLEEVARDKKILSSLNDNYKQKLQLSEKYLDLLKNQNKLTK